MLRWRSVSHQNDVEGSAQGSPSTAVDPNDQAGADLIRFEESGPEPRPKRPHRLRIVMAILAAVAIALLAFVGPKMWRVTQQTGATLNMPETIADLQRDDSEPAKATVRELMSALGTKIDLDQTAAAVYSQEAGGRGRSIMLFGGTALLWSPEQELDAVLKLAEDTGDQIRDLRSVDPGPLGGVMKCGSIGTANAPMAVCGWADHGSIALALFPERSASDAAFLMRTLRSATLSR